MPQHPTTGFDLAETDRLLTTTKQVRQRLDLSRPVPHDELLECIELAGHAPMGGNLERNRWMIIDDAALKAAIAVHFAEIGRPYLAFTPKHVATTAASASSRDVPPRRSPSSTPARLRSPDRGLCVAKCLTSALTG